MQYQLASGETEFGGVDSECRPSSTIYRGKRVGDPFTARRTVHPVRLIHHRDDPTSTANRLVSDDLLHFESSKRSRNVVLSDVVRGGFHGEIVGTYWVNPAGNTSACRHSSEGWHRACSVVPKRAGEHPRRACRRVDPNSLAHRGEPPGALAEVQGPTARIL